MKTIPLHETPEGSKPVDWRGLCEQYSAQNRQLRLRIDQLLAALEEIADDPTGVSIAQAEIAKEALKATV